MTVNTDTVGGNAAISEDGLYRYYLTRYWDKVKAASDRVTWVMLNPSTADATVNDQTIRQCMAFSKAWGFGGLAVVNIFAFRTAYPAELVQAADPIGPWNDEHIDHWLSEADLVIAAWGQSWPKVHADRVQAVTDMVKARGAKVLGLTKSGQPWHPCRRSQSLIPWLWT